ncbi:MAG: hypothetical protein Q9178_007567 [Gyalolechia marmorata]
MKVTECVEVWKEERDDWAFDHFSIILMDGTKVFKAQSRRAFAVHQDINIGELNCPPIRIPTEDIWPPLKDDLTLVPQPIPDGAFQKTRSLATYDPQTSLVKPCELLIHEAQIYEILRKHPHKNIASYLGCISEGGLLKGLCLVRYEESLSDRLRHLDRPLNVSECLKGVKDGLDHLHSLGLNHNDVNPANIMLDKLDGPVIIDFDSCDLEGGTPFGTGTPGWIDGAMITKSEQKNDDFGLMQLRNTLLGSCSSG